MTNSLSWYLQGCGGSFVLAFSTPGSPSFFSWFFIKISSSEWCISSRLRHTAAWNSCRSNGSPRMAVVNLSTASRPRLKVFCEVMFNCVVCCRKKRESISSFSFVLTYKMFMTASTLNQPGHFFLLFLLWLDEWFSLYHGGMAKASSLLLLPYMAAKKIPMQINHSSEVWKEQL